MCVTIPFISDTEFEKVRVAIAYEHGSGSLPPSDADFMKVCVTIPFISDTESLQLCLSDAGLLLSDVAEHGSGSLPLMHWHNSVSGVILLDISIIREEGEDEGKHGKL